MFVSVKFREGDSRSYTYTCDLAVAPGDRVTVDTKDGQKVVIVDAIALDEPPFACKPITGFSSAGAEGEPAESNDGATE